VISRWLLWLLTIPPLYSPNQSLEYLLLIRNVTQQPKGASPWQPSLEEQIMIRNEKKSDRPDQTLARLAANGNAEAFDEIYNRHRSFVYNIALRMTGNAADADDLTQESFVSVLRRVGSFRGEASFTTWLYRIVINQVKMYFRSRSSRPKVQTSNGELPEPGLAMTRRLDRGEQLIDRLAIEKAMLMLAPGYRTAFILHDIEGYKHDEAARMAGHTIGTSKSQLHKARASLRMLLGGRAPAMQS
jgi:RNA polymerase sigma-70 factor (ECF subfamily)